MSVLQLRRDMVVVEDDPVVEIEKPFPLRTIDADVVSLDEYDNDQPRKSFFEILRGWVRGLTILAFLAAYPVFVVLASGVGDKQFVPVDRSAWTAPWAGAAAGLMERHFGELGWASDQPGWAPMARLTAKPAYQVAMAESVGDYVTLMHRQAIARGQEDPDLSAAARLVTASSTGVQLRAARDALISYDRRLHRRAASPSYDNDLVAARLGLIESWAQRSQTALTAAPLGGGPINSNATAAVYQAKGRAMAAWVFIDSMLWSEDSRTTAARAAALEAWKAAAEFHPLLVLNGSPDGSLFGNHAASMGFLIAQAEKATEDFRAAIAGDASAVSDAAVASADPPAPASIN